jgi:hypothetical protein
MPGSFCFSTCHASDVVGVWLAPTGSLTDDGGDGIALSAEDQLCLRQVELDVVFFTALAAAEVQLFGGGTHVQRLDVGSACQVNLTALGVVTDDSPHFSFLLQLFEYPLVVEH